MMIELKKLKKNSEFMQTNRNTFFAFFFNHAQAG
jgi:hypothetical protein